MRLFFQQGSSDSREDTENGAQNKQKKNDEERGYPELQTVPEIFHQISLSSTTATLTHRSGGLIALRLNMRSTGYYNFCLKQALVSHLQLSFLDPFHMLNEGISCFLQQIQFGDGELIQLLEIVFYGIDNLPCGSF